MERILVKNLDVLDDIVSQNNDLNDENYSLKGTMMSLLGFCDDTFNQIIANNPQVSHNLSGFMFLSKFLNENPDRDINKISIDEILNIAKAIISDKNELLELFKLTKRTQNTTHELF
ncbi:hypothetical protein [Campylobacter majalis]|uniref:hypothetical protein n=1 Tax=Campylobacter majalis TaxID=2790656 RepID=UPI003D699E95